MVKKNRAVSKEKVTVIAGALRQKAKTPNTLTLEQMVKELGKEIQEMLDAGYGYEDIAALFAEHEVEIAASSIKSYHRKQKSEIRSQKPEVALQTSETERISEAEQLPAISEASTETRTEPKRKGDRQRTERRTKQEASTVNPQSAFNVTDRNAL